jgi:ferritin
MDRAMLLRHLEQANRHVAEGERHIVEQEQRIAHFARRGQDTTEGQKLLDNFYAWQILHIQHRDRILDELKQQDVPRRWRV